MSERIERSGNASPITPRFIRFLREALGGIALDDIVASEKRRVDYACLRGLLAIEIKTLEEDAERRLENLTNQLKEREDWPEFFGAWPIDSVIANLAEPEKVRRKVSDRIGRAIVNHLKKADEQLEAHAAMFQRRNLVRLVVLINEDHEVYAPDLVMNILQRALARMDDVRPMYEHVDAVLFLTERHAKRAGGDIAFPAINVTGPSVDHAEWKGDLLDYVVAKWSAWRGARHIIDEAKVVNSFATIEQIPEHLRRQDLWALEYRRRPYMQAWTEEQIRDRWDELIVRSMFAFLKASPIRLSKAEIARDMELMAHLQIEIGRRGITLPRLTMNERRTIAAGMRLQVPPPVLAWLASESRNHDQ